MCDCYSHKCKMCEEYIPIHLEDYSTEREEIEIYCEDHIPEDISDGVLSEYLEDEDMEDRDDFYTFWDRYCLDEADSDKNKTKKFFMRFLTDNSRKHQEGNCYNGCEKILKIFGKDVKYYENGNWVDYKIKED